MVMNANSLNCFDSFEKMVIVNNADKPPPGPEKPFMLKNSNKDFLERQKSIFDQLNTLPTLRQDAPMDVDPERSKPSTSRSTRHFRGKESIFKVPQDPVNYMRNMPDFKKNPHKWKKYSLADVEEMSDRSNTSAALSFLNELKTRNKEEEVKAEEPQKIIFKKKVPVEESDEAKPSFRSSKMVMPEYVVGQKIKKEKKNRSLRIGGNKQLKLDHLLEDE